MELYALYDKEYGMVVCNESSMIKEFSDIYFMIPNERIPYTDVTSLALIVRDNAAAYGITDISKVYIYRTLDMVPLNQDGTVNTSERIYDIYPIVIYDDLGEGRIDTCQDGQAFEIWDPYLKASRLYYPPNQMNNPNDLINSLVANNILPRHCEVDYGNGDDNMQMAKVYDGQLITPITFNKGV